MAATQPRRNRMRRALPLIVILAVAAILGGFAWKWVREARRTAAHNVSEVKAGILYRSGQPDAAMLPEIRNKYHIRTIISFLAQDPDETPATETEEEFYQANGIRFVHIPLKDPMFTESEAAQFLVIVTDSSSQPVLVHCESGRNRTGYAIAYYRIAVDHWSFDAAIEEARRLGYPESSEKKDTTLRKLEAAVKATSGATAPSVGKLPAVEHP
jgi:protein tyrosine/serine phosphatase